MLDFRYEHKTAIENIKQAKKYKNDIFFNLLKFSKPTSSIKDIAIKAQKRVKK